MRKKPVAAVEEEEDDWGKDGTKGWRAGFAVRRALERGFEPYCDAAGLLRLGLAASRLHTLRWKTAEAEMTA